MFIWKPHRPEGHEASASGLPEYADWVRDYQQGDWHIGWYCLECLTHIWDTRPSVTRAIVTKATNLVYPIDPPWRPFVRPNERAEGYFPAAGDRLVANARAEGHTDALLRAKALGNAYAAPPMPQTQAGKSMRLGWREQYTAVASERDPLGLGFGADPTSDGLSSSETESGS